MSAALASHAFDPLSLWERARVRAIGATMPNNYRKPQTRKLRQSMTDTESKLWSLLRNRRHFEAKFRRQYPIGPYTVDFFCHEHGVVIETDGGQHLESRHDVIRTRYLEQQGYAVLRFWNNEVLMNQDGVLERIREVLLERVPSPAAPRRPLPEGEARKTKATP